MNAIATPLAALIAAVLLIAGLSKLGRSASTANTLVEFGLGAGPARQLALLLPALEIGLAVALFVPPLAWAALIGSSLLLLLFLGFVALSLARGKRPSCNCFGQLQSAPIGAGTLLRNLLLVLATLPPLALGSQAWSGGLGALVATLLGEASGLHWLAIALALAVMLQAWLNIKLISQQGRLILQIDNLAHRISGAGLDAPVGGAQIVAPPALPLGSPPPGFASHTLAGQPVTDRWLQSRGEQLLLFVGADCAPCLELARELKARTLSLPLTVIGHGSESAVRELLAPLLGQDIVLQTGSELNERFGVIATPSAMRLDAQGKIASAPAIGHDAVLALAQAQAKAGHDGVDSGRLALSTR